MSKQYLISAKMQRIYVTVSKAVFCWAGWLSMGGCVVTMPKAVVTFRAGVWIVWTGG